MVIGHGPTCISALVPCSWLFTWGAANPSCTVQGGMSLKALAISLIPSFQQPFHASFGDLTFAFFRTLLCKTCMVTSFLHSNTQNGKSCEHHDFLSKPHAYAISCRPKRW